jgi:hypothetical protein
MIAVFNMDTYLMELLHNTAFHTILTSRGLSKQRMIEWTTRSRRRAIRLTRSHRRGIRCAVKLSKDRGRKMENEKTKAS